MIQPLNGAAQLNGLAGLAAHLTDPGDRETYAALISYFHSLPPRDELFRLAELLGFLSLLGQRLPDALSEFLQALREETKAADEYRAKVDERLARLPEEIAAGVNPESIARAMSEAFRQQIAACGLEQSARMMGTSVAALQRVSSDLTTALRPLTDQYAGVGATISRELTKLTNASAQIRQHNTSLIAQAADERWRLKLFFCLGVLCMGFVLGLIFEKRSASRVMLDLGSRLTTIEATIRAPHRGISAR